jgi:hypothetical protein
MFNWRDPAGIIEWHDSDWEAVQGGHPRQKGGEGTAQETYTAEPRQYTLVDLERARSGGGAPNPQRPQEQPQRRTRELELAQLELSVIESQLRLRGRPARSSPTTTQMRRMVWFYAAVLDQRLSELRHQTALHHRQGATDHALGA